MRRVVITGMGLVTPLANGREASWKKLTAGESGLGLIDIFDTSDLACKIAGQVPWVTGRGGGSADDPDSFNPDVVMSAKEQRRVDEFILYGVAAADEAIADSGWKPETYEEKCATGVLLGSGIGGLATIAATAVDLHL
jgi:3-oxoacyl-[acyl-carrier-protein] synthase II